MEHISSSHPPYMALIRCKECNQTVSTEAYTCPHCGAPRRPAPPQLPPQIHVQQAPSQKKSVGLLGGCFIVILVLVILAAIGNVVSRMAGVDGPASSSGESAPSPRDLKREVMEQVSIEEWSWRKDGLGMEATFKIKNGARFGIKDIKIKCVHSAKSGTRIDSNTRTIYEIVKAGETREFKDFDMGFIHSQIDTSSASIQDFVIIGID